MQHKLRVTHHDYEWHPRYFAVLCGLFCGLYVITSALNSKMIDFFGLTLPGGILLFPLCTIITDIINEIYGFNRTRQAIWTALAVTIIYAITTQLLMILPPSAFWAHQDAFENIFSTSWRIALAGCCAWLAGEFVNAYIITKMKIFQNAKFMAGRFIGSTLVGQFFDTLVFASIAFLGTMPWHNFLILCSVVWIIKVCYEIIALPISLTVTQKIKQLEGVEHFDQQRISLI